MEEWGTIITIITTIPPFPRIKAPLYCDPSCTQESLVYILPTRFSESNPAGKVTTSFGTIEALIFGIGFWGPVYYDYDYDE